MTGATACEAISQVREPEPVRITVVSARNLRGSKADVLTCLLKAEFNNSSLGESGKTEVSPDGDTDFNFTATHQCSFEDPSYMDDLAFKPVILTLVEILPREKKQKEEKSNPLGQCTVDLLPLLKEGATNHNVTLIVNPIPGSALDNLAPEIPKPEIDVSLTVANPLINDVDSNVFAITLESLYSPPDSWSPSQSQYSYTVSLPLPASDEKENTLSFPLGVLKSGSDKDAANPRAKRWANPGTSAQGASQFIPGRLVPEPASEIDQEDGELKAKDDIEFRVEAETQKNRVHWNIERRAFLQPSATAKLQTQIASSRYWPLEVWRVQQAKETKGKKEEDAQHSFHGLIYVNMAKLLYPGVTRIRGAFKVCPYNENELLEKTRRKTRQSERAPSASDLPPPPAEKAAEKKAAAAGEKPNTGSKDAPKEEKSKKDPANKSKAGAHDEDGVHFDAEGQQYVDAGSYVTVEIELLRPLIPKKEPGYLAAKVSEYIPARPRFPLRSNGADKAVEDFHSQVVSIVNLVLEQYRDLFADEILGGNREQSADAMKQRYQKLIYELNTSGKYFAFREQLKHSVIKIVREKYLKTTNFESQAELQKFLSELYVFLIDEMHRGLGKILTLEDQTPVPEPLTSADQLKHFAKEAEANDNMPLAHKYYLERISRNNKDPDNWFDYACFNLLVQDLPKAIECTKECVSIGQQHMRGLILYGILMLLDEKFDVAEVFLEAATNFYSESVLSWTCLALYYDTIGNDIGYEMALTEANRVNIANAAAERDRIAAEQAALEASQIAENEEADAENEEGVQEEEKQASDQQEPGASQGGKRGSSTLAVPPAGVRIGSADKSAPASRDKKKAKESRNATPGHSKEVTQVEPEVEEVRPETPVPKQSVFMIAAEFLLDLNAMKLADRALAHELTNAELQGGTGLDYSLALARLNLQTGDLIQAQKAVQAAIVLDFKNADAWSLDGHIHFLKGSMEDARVSYERVLSFAPADQMHVIYLRLASIYLQEERFQEAKQTYLEACRQSPSCVSWQGVGVACYRLGELSEAEDALCEANILNNKEPNVWAFLTLVCLQTGRAFEAEQAYKFSLKVGLNDSNLLSEIHELQQVVGFGNPSF